MAKALSDIGKKGLALLILLVAAWILFKMVLGVVAAVAWIFIALAAVVAIVWALRVL